MNAWAVALITFGCVFGGALAGIRLRSMLPQDHLSDEAKATVNLITGLLATLSALVLGLLIASAKTSFDRVSEQFKEAATKMILIDRALAQYGPEAKDVREAIRNTYAAHLFPSSGVHVDASTGLGGVFVAQELEQKIRGLAPSTDLQRARCNSVMRFGRNAGPRSRRPAQRPRRRFWPCSSSGSRRCS